MTLYIIFTVLTLSQHTVLHKICISSLFVNTELNKCMYLDAKQLAISELVEYPSIDSAILVVRPLILEISFQNDCLFETRKEAATLCLRI